MSENELLRIGAILKVWREYENSSNEQYGKTVLETLHVLLTLTNSLHTDQVALPPWKIWAEPVIFKFCYHVSSLVQLFNGTALPFKKEGKDILIFDEPSMFILFRAALENYLTFFYLFTDDVTDEEKLFRSNVWRYSGFKQRARFEITSDEAKKRQEEESRIAEQLKKEIEGNCFFIPLNLKIKKEVLKGRKPRLQYSWPDLIVRSNLRHSLYRNLYGYKSNYSHSEFISVLQLHEGKYGHSKANTRSHHSLLLLNTLIGKIIFEVMDYFPTTKVHFDKLKKPLKEELLYLKEISSNIKMEIHPD